MSGEDRVRVAHVITRLIIGGAQETVLLAAALADRSRFDPVIVTGPQTGSEGSLHDKARRRGVEVVVLPELVRQVSPVADVRSVGALARAFQELDVHVVHTNSSKAGVVGRLAARRAHVPRVIHTVHGWPFHEHQPAAVAAVWRTLERRSAPLAERLVVVADVDRDKGLAAGIGRHEQYVTVRSGLELALYGADSEVRGRVRNELGIAPNAVVLGAVNRLSPQKDPLNLLRAVAGPLTADRSARLLLVGDGPLAGEVSRLAGELALGEQVVAVGLRDDVPALMTAMDVFVSASLWEGLPRTVLQAIATGLPVVATAADGIVDVVQDGSTGLLAPPGRPVELGHAVQRVLDDPALAASLAGRASFRLPEFDALEMVRRLERLYLGEPV